MFWIFLRDSLQLIISPKNGWEDIAYDDSDVQRLITGGFIPWLVIASLVSLLGLYYTQSFSVLSVLHSLISTFLVFFIGYYISVALFSFYMPSLTHGDSIESHNNTFLLYNVALLATIGIIRDALPIDLAMLNFFPLYVLYIMWRGARYLKVSRLEQGRFILLSLIGVIVPPYLLQVLFSLILPS